MKITRVENSKDLNEFIGLPWKIYAGDPHWVPPLRIAVKDILDEKRNPFFKHAKKVMFLARKGEDVVGRIIGVVDQNHNVHHEEKTAFFGFFEAVDSLEVTQGLVAEVANWARAQGMTCLRGPMNPSTNHECGLLVDGFDDPPAVMMTYNPPYYSRLLEGAGFKKSKDLYAYLLDSEKQPFSPRLQEIAERLKQRGQVSFRAVNLKHFEEELETILDIYNDAWEKNWGFVPMEPEEFRHMAKDMKQILDPRMLLIAEVQSKPAAFALALPDVNEIFKKIPDGKLFPFGLFKLLLSLKGPFKHQFGRARIITLGIKKAYREVGIGAMLYSEYYLNGPKYGYKKGEASWILEDNGPMNKALEKMKAERYKTYRIYDRPLA